MTTAQLDAIVIMATLTAKQQRALSQAPKSQRAKLQQMFQSQNNGGGRSRQSGNTSGNNRSHATRVLAQGAGAITTRPFGSGKQVNGAKKALLHGLNARLPYHLGLPRAVGAYQVIRTTNLHTTLSPVVILAPVLRRWATVNNSPQWHMACGIEAITGSNPMNATNNARMIPMPMESLGDAAEVVPAALTVQVMCPSPLQTADGIYTMGRVSQSLSLGDDTRTWNAFKAQFDSFFKPRLLTGGKLALRGVTCNAIPLDMNEFAEFAPPVPAVPDPGIFTWNSATSFGALSPIVITHESSSVPMTYLITIEWRVRFDPGSAAAASHVYHPPTPDGVWADIMKSASSLGHGVVDIADSIADVGEAVGAAV
jgi:hypothetical protein